MNAHTPIVADATQARSLVDQLEADLDQIGALASAACIVIEHQLGAGGPAKELTVLLALIEETVAKAEGRRSTAWGALSGMPLLA